MKIKCPLQGCCPDECQYPQSKQERGDCVMEFEIPTASLIAELEKRGHDCMTCKNRTSIEPDLCVNCLWCYDNKIEDNFKPAK